MVGQAFAPEYRGVLGSMSVNTSYDEVLRTARERSRQARGDTELAQARLAEAEACRRLGMLDDAETAWRSSYRVSRHNQDRSGMAWALWSAGTLARQRGRVNLALRWLCHGRDLAQLASDRIADGYTRAGIAETVRIQGDYVRARPLHEELLAEAREADECRHIVWALEGLAQIDRHEGLRDTAWKRFVEAEQVAHRGGDDRGRAWALRGMADLKSLDGASEEALQLLSQGEKLCRAMNLENALAYNRKMRGNVLFRACWYDEAVRTYRGALGMFERLNEPRGSVLAQLGLLKSQDRLGRDRATTEREMRSLRETAMSHELYSTAGQVDNALAQLDAERDVADPAQSRLESARG